MIRIWTVHKLFRGPKLEILFHTSTTGIPVFPCKLIDHSLYLALERCRAGGQLPAKQTLKDRIKSSFY